MDARWDLDGHGGLSHLPGVKYNDRSARCRLHCHRLRRCGLSGDGFLRGRRRLTESRSGCVETRLQFGALLSGSLHPGQSGESYLLQWRHIAADLGDKTQSDDQSVEDQDQRNAPDDKRDQALYQSDDAPHEVCRLSDKRREGGADGQPGSSSPSLWPRGYDFQSGKSRAALLAKRRTRALLNRAAPGTDSWVETVHGLAVRHWHSPVPTAVVLKSSNG